MSTAAPLQAQAASQQAQATSHQTLVQRQCAGKSAPASSGGECAECKRESSAGGETGLIEAALGRGAMEPVQRVATNGDTRGAAHDFARVPVHANAGGLPADLMAGLRQLSGVDLPSVKVHYQSSEPSRLNALAYTQGADIHIAPGQEKHLAHEAWHVVQQMQGRVAQTAAIDGMPLNDSDALEREADAMGAKAEAVGAHAAATRFAAALSGATGAGSDDEPFVAAIGTGHAPVVQRAANFVPGTVTRTTNLAAHVIAGNRDMGFTPPTLNGTATLSGAAAQGAIKAPVLGGRANADGTATSWVTTTPTNEASFTMKLPSAGPWSTVAKKAEVASLFASLGLAAKAACTGDAASTLSFKGKPSDATFAANVETHENLHAADHKTGFDAVIVPWDAKIEAARVARTEFSAAAAPAADAKLFAAMGGTPAAIASAQFDKWIALNNVTHGGATLATGHTATASNSAADATCGTSSFDAT